MVNHLALIERGRDLVVNPKQVNDPVNLYRIFCWTPGDEVMVDIFNLIKSWTDAHHAII